MDVNEFADNLEKVAANIGEVVRGKDTTVKQALYCLFAGGHLLIEDRPGVGKTLLAKAIAASLSVNFKRIQFTPDLQPTDVTGTTVYDSGKAGVEEPDWDAGRGFRFRPGPIFANVVLADEINRASPRTQSALLEVMEERQVTFDGTTYPLPDRERSGPFFVVATQNPFDAAGTYPLPEAQLDRFLMRISMGYPHKDDERRLLQDDAAGVRTSGLAAVLDNGQVDAMTACLRDQVTTTEEVYNYAIEIVQTTRTLALPRLPDGWAGTFLNADVAPTGPWLRAGASPRATVALLRAARAVAAARRSTHVAPEDIQEIAVQVIGHRLQPVSSRLRATVAGDQVVRDVLDHVKACGVYER